LACTAQAAMAARLSGTIKRRMIKGVPPARSSPKAFRRKRFPIQGILRLLRPLNNPWNWAIARRKDAPPADNWVNSPAFRLKACIRTER
jgi:hypothetical protein